MATFSPSQAEIGIVNQIFSAADPQKLGIITGEAAVKIFTGAKLPPTTLGEIWAIADKENNGFLTRKGVSIALRLIGHAQQGESVKEALVDKPGPLARIEGISAGPQRTATIPSSPPPTSPPIRASLHPPLTPEDKSKFLRLFLKCGPVNGLLNGDTARDVFLKSKLPFEKLAQIWSLADTQDRGSLDQTDFTIAMYLIQAVMSGQLPTIPSALPLGLYEEAGGRSTSSIVSHSTGNSISLSPSLTGSFASSVSPSSGFTPTPLASQNTGSVRSRLQPQMTGQDHRLSMMLPPQASLQLAATPATTLGASAFGGVSLTSQLPWDVSPDEKSRFDKFFDQLDVERKGYIEGGVAVPFMLQSKLDSDILAQVWDLADLNNDGHLTRDGFAVAMHLIQGKLAGKDIPPVLPLSLIPPSLRSGREPPPVPARAPVPEPVRDLLWDDSPPASATAPQAPISPPSVQATPTLRSQGTGQTLQQTNNIYATKSPSASAAVPFGAAFRPIANRDLLSDDEDATPASVPDNSAEIGNLQNQITSTSRSLETTKAERQTMEQTLASQASQLSTLQTQLSSAKAAYETETKLLANIRERFASQSADIQKTREELIRAESDLSAVRVERTEIEGNLLRDKEEIRDLQRKMKEVGDEIEQAKGSVEKSKKETKHQKGLLAIARKQLATREAERAKILKELEETEREAQETTEELEGAEQELAKELPPIQTNGSISPAPPVSNAVFPLLDTPIAAAQPLPASTPSSLTSPGTKSNNPFERLALSTSGSRPASPFSAPAVDLFSAPTPQTGMEAPKVESPFGSVDLPSVMSPSVTDAPRTDSPFMNTAEQSVPQVPLTDAFRPASPFLHVAETSTSTTAPSTGPQASIDVDDPFGLGVPDERPSTEISDLTLEKANISQLGNAATVEPFASVTKDVQVLSDLIPDTAAPIVQSGKAEATNLELSNVSSPTLDAEAAQFPPIDAPIPGSLPGFDDNSHVASTDLDAKLVEKDDESDSDSDDDGEFHDAKARLSLSGAERELEKDAAQPTISATLGVKEPTIPVTNGARIPPSPPSQTFDDASGLESATPKVVPPRSPSTLSQASDLTSDIFTTPTKPVVKETPNGKIPEQLNLFDVPSATATAASGISAFDEAMGKISPSPGTAPQFKLDSAFDDNFDFTAAKVEAGTSLLPSPSLPQPEPATNGSPLTVQVAGVGAVEEASKQTQDTLQAGKTISFDDAFGSVSSRASFQPPAGDHGISFEEAFGGTSSKALAFDDTFGSVKSTASKPSAAKSTPFPVQSPPGSPTAATPATPSTVRSTSPPPRVNSPKPRVSTGSSNEGVVAGKAPPQTRHSKLSIRLPFGRKDKKKSKPEPPPVPPPQFLSPVAEPSGRMTPIGDDDVEPVKQLCGMGFSRTQAIEALESHGYNVQRALNSLLGTT